jgi:hypothetical protein
MQTYVKIVGDQEDIGNAIPLEELTSLIDKEVPIQVGRTMHYRSRGSADGVFAPRCVAAIVTQVWENDQLSLAVLNPTGLFFDKDIKHENLADGVLAGGTWHRLSECQHREDGFGY